MLPLRTLLLLLAALPLLAQSPAESLLQQSRPLVIGHRGFCAAAPENTLPSFRLAAAAGADLVELDYYHSKDGKLVVIHDGTLDRTTSAPRDWSRTNLVVSAQTWDQMRTLDAGSWFSPLFKGTSLPSLDEALDTIQTNSITLIERKEGDARSCLELLRKKSLVNRVVVQAFDWDYLADFHRLEPTQVLAALGPWKTFRGKTLSEDDKWLSPHWVDEAAEAGAKAVVWNKQVRREAVDYAHQHGIKVWTYTINDPALANQLLDLGVDGLISDNPAKTWRTLALRNPTQKAP